MIAAYTAVAICVAGVFHETVSARGSRKWPTVQGRTLDVESIGIFSDGPLLTFDGFGSVVENFRVSYRYVVGDAEFVGEQTVSFRPPNRPSVYFAPSNPEISAIQPGRDWSAILGYSAAGFLAFVVGLISQAESVARRAA